MKREKEQKFKQKSRALDCVLFQLILDLIHHVRCSFVKGSKKDKIKFLRHPIVQMINEKAISMKHFCYVIIYGQTIGTLIEGEKWQSQFRIHRILANLMIVTPH